MKSILLETLGGCGLCGGSCHLVLGIVCVPVQVVPLCGDPFSIVLGPVAVRGCRLVQAGLFLCLRVGCLVGMLYPVCFLPGVMRNGCLLQKNVVSYALEDVLSGRWECGKVS